ncbi:hypothetical protein OG799_32750 [Micromonospora sp. NBC_00898]|uniref:hypothetical protein n=1 Tax=Micromonospora sp. NBC_00898 TaxID=2975981 RepID=UPI00386425B8|nr:hypothetical protein OG799_32750 [Micromonospora sp. NBC_00898]
MSRGAPASYLLFRATYCSLLGAHKTVKVSGLLSPVTIRQRDRHPVRPPISVGAAVIVELA